MQRRRVYRVGDGGQKRTKCRAAFQVPSPGTAGRGDQTPRDFPHRRHVFIFSCIDPARALPLYVDLDGTLIRGDTTQQQSLALLRANPAALLKAALAMKNGRAAAKKIIADHVALDAAALPYRPEVIAYAEQARRDGRRVVLATGAERRTADAVAAHLGLFDGVIATEHNVNLTSTRKLKAVLADGGDRFEYLGDSHADAAVFDAAEVGGWIGVKNICRTAANTRGLHRLCSEPVNRARDVVRLIRPHQWTKNLLVFLPLVTSHRLGEATPTLHAALAAVALSLVASACYVVNDGLDIDVDQRHPAKRRRPLAHGDVTLVFAAGLMGSLLVLGVLAAALAGKATLGAVTVYLALNLGYSLLLKRRLLVDVLTLAALYAWRPVVGGVAAGVWLSESLVIFCAFFFVSLALLKRFTELKPHFDLGKTIDLPGRGYQPQDVPVVQITGLMCGVASVLVLAFYVGSATGMALYAEPRWLWLWCPLVGYWLVRAWLLAGRGTLHHDPVVFAFTDTRSYGVLVGMAAAAWLAGPKGF